MNGITTAGASTSKAFDLRKRIVAVVLAALMVMGMTFVGAGIASADPTGPAAPAAAPAVTPTGDEFVYNPEQPTPSYTVPQDGYYKFVGEDFVPETEIVVILGYTGYTNVLVGTFEIDEDGIILANIAGDPYPGVIIPKDTPVGAATLKYYYKDGMTLAYTLGITVAENPYRANLKIVYDFGNGNKFLNVDNADQTPSLFAPDLPIYVKVDYAESPVYGPFYTDSYGYFNTRVALQGSGLPTIAPGNHTFTLLASEKTVDSVFYPRVSLSYNLSL
jgi:hypothetical protein